LYNTFIPTLPHISRRVQGLLTETWQIWFIVGIAVISALTSGISTDTDLIAPTAASEPQTAIRAAEAVETRATASDVGEISSVRSAALAFADSVRVYIAVRGDTVKSIASKFGVSTETITSANPGLKSSVPAGKQVSILPVAGSLYSVTAQDSLATVAERFGVSPDAIRKYNPSYQDIFAEGSGSLVIPKL